ncbi:hypothetical protein V4U86_19120 [Mycobacterium sp. AMU20-3851]|uniref:hypothetical protein n=1 Tax=Mycobacterium sp. AMU20-3851 TaxID=3122055 RepID=UPI003754E408
MQDSELFDATAAHSADSDRSSLEQRLDELAVLAKEATQLATKVRTGLNSLAENALSGRTGTASGQLKRVSDSIRELTDRVERLSAVERKASAVDIRDAGDKLAREVIELLDARGITVTRGPEPYWLAYPSWFTVAQGSKGQLEVVLNGDKLDSVRPSVVADAVAGAVNEKFNVKQFAAVLTKIRQVLRRAGVTTSSIGLDDIYEILSEDGSGKGPQRGGLTKGEFYYSVHRLAEEMDRASAPSLRFPPANRTDMVFFSKESESRKYLSVEFLDRGV